MGSVKVPITPESGRERLGSERPEDFLATDQERERCKKILRRSSFGLWDELKMPKACVDQLRSSWYKRHRVEGSGLQEADPDGAKNGPSSDKMQGS